MTDQLIENNLIIAPIATRTVTQNVRDDNGQNLKDGSTEPPAPQGQGAAGTGTVRAAAFPYIGSPNNPAQAIPGC